MLGFRAMIIEIKKLPKSEIQITVEVPQDLMDQYETEATRRISDRMDIPGFRRGQAPKAFVMSQLGPDAFFQEVLNVALPRSYFEAVKREKLQVISRPDVKVLSKAPLKYEARAAIFPEVTLKGVEKIKIPAEAVTITDKEIDEVVMEMRKYRATYKPLEREIQKGDRLEVDFQGYDDAGAALDKTKSANHPLFVGEGTLVPGFEENLVGMKSGEKKKFPVKFPKDFHYEPLKSKTVNFEVEVKRAEEPIFPEVNEDFVSQVMGEKKSVPDFRDAIKTDLHKRKTSESRRDRENVLLEKFLKEAKFEVSPMLIDEEIDFMMQDLKREIESRGLSFDTYMEKMSQEKRDIRKEYGAEAEKRIRIRLILNHLFRTLGLEVTEEEMQKAQERLLEAAPQDQRAQMEKSIAEQGEVYLRLKNNLLLEKVFVKFLD